MNVATVRAGVLAVIAAIATPPATVDAQPVEVVHAFSGVPVMDPSALALGSDGNFYRTTCRGGPADAGVVFTVTPAGDATVLYTFAGATDGTCPHRLVHARDGNLYGTTARGGAFNLGTVFRLTLAGTLTVLHAFEGNGDAASPRAGLTEGTDACALPPGVCVNLYGTTSAGGTANLGTVFRIAADGTYAVVHSFAGGPDDGAAPAAPLVQVIGDDRAYYGTTGAGGTSSNGTVFRMTAAGAVTIVHAFSGASPDGVGPSTPMVTDGAGTLYGATVYRWFLTPNTNGHCRVIFRVETDRTRPFSIVPAHAECFPSGSLTLTLTMATNEDLFGTLDFFGSTSLFKLRVPGGTDEANRNLSISGEGGFVISPLVQGADGNLYGSAAAGPLGGGTVFRWRVFPDPPVTVAISAVHGRVRLSWLPVAVATSYRIVRRQPGCGSVCETVVGNTAATTFEDTPGPRGTYRYVVYALNSLGTSAASYEVSATLGRAAPADFDGDGLSDLAVYRPSTGVWSIRQSATGAAVTVTWGGGADVPVAEDYDGDAMVDAAIFRPSTGTWHIRGTSSAAAMAVPWGGLGDIPLPGDYDGDGFADIVVFRPAEGRWYLRCSSSSPTDAATIDWGGSTDKPVPADYDGDGRMDIAIVRPATNQWFIRLSSTLTMSVVTWGQAGDIPVPGDYDADGKADLATFRPADGTWRIRQSGALLAWTTSWGGPSDIPVPGDYDGDGRTDVAVNRPSTGIWYIRPSDALVDPRAILFGVAADSPAPGDFDGDGRADVAVLRASVWYIRASSSLQTVVIPLIFPDSVPVPGDYDGDGKTDAAQFYPTSPSFFIKYSSTGATSDVWWGAPTDLPVVNDYDGDGKTDVAVFRASAGTWFIRYSGSSTSAAVEWGGIGDVPVPGDYDGDGRSDVAIFRPSTGEWHIRRSADGSTATISWGGAGDRPVQADYDGDGRTDVAIFRPSTAMWYIRLSGTLASMTGAWGAPGDVPVPADYDGDGTTDPAVFRPATGAWYIPIGADFADVPLMWGLPADIPILGRQ